MRKKMEGMYPILVKTVAHLGTHSRLKLKYFLKKLTPHTGYPMNGITNSGEAVYRSFEHGSQLTEAIRVSESSDHQK